MKDLVIVRGAGDLATGVIQKLWRSGFSVLALETEIPTTIRRHVALSSAMTEGTAVVEDMTAVKITSLDQLQDVWEKGEIPVFADPEGTAITALKPLVVVDAILAKRNLGTTKDMAPITIALGPGFSAPEDVHVAIETMRGHNLGRLIFKGSPLPNTGIPGLVGGESAKRVVHAPVNGTVTHKVSLGDKVEIGDVLFYIDETPVPSPLKGIVRGLIGEGIVVRQGLKSADIDPRLEVFKDVNTISDKARCLGGGVLEAVLYLKREDL